jgi:hypothetical protein
MVALGAWLIAACLSAIVLAWFVPALRMFGLVAGIVVVYVVAWMVWWGLLFLQVVRMDPVLQWLGVYRLHAPWTALVFLVPPIVPAAAFALVAARHYRSIRF